MTIERKGQIRKLFKDRWMKLTDKTAAEQQMLKVIQELLAETPIDTLTLESEYKRGYDEGVADERDRQYDAKMAARKAKKAEEAPPEPELPFGEVE